MTLVLSGESSVRVHSSTYASIKESMNEVTRKIEDASWINLSSDDRKLDDDPDDRLKLIKRARLAAKWNPLAHTAIGLLQHYVLGQGITFKARDRKRVGKLVDELMQHPVNQEVLTGHEGLKQFLERVYVDGDRFIVQFVDRNEGTIHYGRIDATLVVDVIMDPENDAIPKWYKVRDSHQVYDWKTETYVSRPTGDFIYYRHFRNEDPAPPGIGAKLKEGLILQASWDKQGKFGRSGLASALDFLSSHRAFVEDRVSLNRAAASIAWRKKRKGSPSDIQQEAARLASSVSVSIARMETNPPKATASTIVENEGSTLDWVKTDTGGAAAGNDERIVRMMAGSGMGHIPNHYFGDEAQANLATATSMELPLLKHYEDRQQFVRDVLADLIEFYLAVCEEAGRIGPRDDSSRYADRVTTPQGVMASPDQAGAGQIGEAFGGPGGQPIPYAPPPLPGVRLIPRPKDPNEGKVEEDPDPNEPVDWYVDIDFPPIVQKDIKIFMDALKVLSEMLPTENIEAKKFVVEQALSALSINEIDKAMEVLFPADLMAVMVPAAPPPEAALPELDEPITESLRAYRRRRVLRAVQEASQFAAARG